MWGDCIRTGKHQDVADFFLKLLILFSFLFLTFLKVEFYERIGLEPNQPGSCSNSQF